MKNQRASRNFCELITSCSTFVRSKFYSTINIFYTMMFGTSWVFWDEEGTKLIQTHSHCNILHTYYSKEERKMKFTRGNGKWTKKNYANSIIVISTFCFIDLPLIIHFSLSLSLPLCVRFNVCILWMIKVNFSIWLWKREQQKQQQHFQF